MQHELKQVEVRLKLTDKAGIFSMERIDTPEKAVSVLAPVLAELDREEVCVVNLDGKGRPINFNVVSIGSVNTSLVTGRELYKTAILSNAAGMIMLHNHPSSDLQMSVSDRNVTEKMMYASLLLDIEFYDHVIVAGGTGKTFSIRENVPELFEPSHYAHLISHVADGVKEEVSYHGTSPVTYEILQIKDGSNGKYYRFWGMNYVQKKGLQINVSDYESKYQGELKPGETLDTLYERFNIHRPEDFTGHSLSVSDVIVLESGGDKRAFYVDTLASVKSKIFSQKNWRDRKSHLPWLSVGSFIPWEDTGMTFQMQKKRLQCGKSIKKALLTVSQVSVFRYISRDSRKWKICKWIWCLVKRWIWICCVIIRRSMEKKLPFKRFVNWLKICRM